MAKKGRFSEQSGEGVRYVCVKVIMDANEE